MDSFDRLLTVTSRLRAPDGCPWDRAQTPQTLARHLQGELAEVIDAIDDGDDDALSEEIGDAALGLGEPSCELFDPLHQVPEQVAPSVVVDLCERGTFVD